MGRFSDSVNEPAVTSNLPYSQEIKAALVWFYGSLSEVERVEEWRDWEKRQKRFMRDHLSADYVQFCIQPAKFIHAQWVHRNRPML